MLIDHAQGLVWDLVPPPDEAAAERGAALLAPYTDDPGNTGLITLEPSVALELMKRALRAGVQVQTRAIGDRGNRSLLELYAALEEDRHGSIEPGKAADFSVFDQDLLTIPAAGILKTRNRYTIIGGNVVFQAK